MIDAAAEKAKFEAETAAFHNNVRHDRTAITHGLRWLAAQALSVAPDATHMLLESSDQGNFMCAPQWLNVGTENVAEEEWDDFYNDNLDDLSDIAVWFEWGAAEWEAYADPEHPFTLPRNGYYALDLRRIVADAEEEQAGRTLKPVQVPLKADLKAEVLDGDNDGKYARVEIGPNHQIPERTVTVYVDPTSGVLIVELDGPFAQFSSDGLEAKVVINDDVVYDSTDR